MGQVISNIVSSCTTSNEYEDDVDERSSRSGKHDHEEIQDSRFGTSSTQSISSTTTLSSSSSSLLHPFAVLLTTMTDVDDHSNNQNSNDEAVHGSHVTPAGIVKRLVTISDYNFVEKKSSETENDHDEAALVLEPLAQHKQEEGMLVLQKVLDDEHHHPNDNQDNGGAKEIEVKLAGMREECTTTTTASSGAVTYSPSAAAAPSLTLHPSAVLLTSTQSSNFVHKEDYHDETVADIMKNVVTISAHCNEFVGKKSPNIEDDDDGTPLLKLAAQSQSLPLPLPMQEKEILVTEQVLDGKDDADDEHHNNQDNGEGDEGGGTKEAAIEKDGGGTKEAELEVVIEKDEGGGTKEAKLEVVIEKGEGGGTKEAELEVVIEKDDVDKKKSILMNSTNEQNNIIIVEERVIKHYSSYHKILLVGEGDFSFSACLARYFDSAINMVATSLDSQELLWAKYSRAKQHVDELRNLGCQILHGVDVHVMDSHPELKRMRFERIIYNFPHAGHFLRLREQQCILIAMHQKLLLGFFKTASKMLVDEGGEVHVSHRDDDPYNRWEIVKLAKQAGLALKEKVEFWESDYPGYNIKRGSTRRSDETFPLGYYSFTFKFIISGLQTLH